MIQADSLLSEFERSGFGLVAGVPCSYLTPLINTTLASPRVRYVGATNEGDAVAIACGAELGGVHGVAIFQNSGLGNTVNPLTSLTSAFKLPVLLLCSWRGQPGGAPDEPQHGVMGEITPRLFELMGIPWELFPEEEGELAPVLARAAAHMKSQRTPFALIVRKGLIAGDTSAPAARPPGGGQDSVSLEPPRTDAPLHPDEALWAIQTGARESDVLLATTGFTGRALYAHEDRPNQLYMVGSMGCASSMGLGLALVRPERRVVVIDGDGAMLMRMGAVATIGYERPPNLLHVLLDNGVHDSTGAQATVSPFVDLAAVARDCGYERVLRASTPDELRTIIARDEPGTSFVHVKTLPRADRKLPRPEIRPDQVADRLRAWLEANG